MDAITRSIVQAGLDASSYVAGARQVEAANRGMATSAEAVVTAGAKVEQVTARGGQAFERLQRELDRGYAALQRYERAQETITRAQERGLVSAERAQLLLGLAQQRYLGLGSSSTAAATGVVAFGAANDNATSRTAAMAQLLDQAGAQFGTLAERIATGRASLADFVAQGVQMAGALGPAGIFAGVALAVAGVVVALSDAEAAQRRLQAALERTDSFYRTVTEAARAYQRGLQDEAEALATLELRYRDLNEARRQYELRQAEERRAALAGEQTALARDANRVFARVAMEAERQVAAEREAALRARQIGAPPPIPAEDARAALAAIYEFRAAGEQSAEAILRVVEALRQAQMLAGPFREGLDTAVGALDPFVQRAEELDRRLRPIHQIIAILTGTVLPGVEGSMEGAGTAAQRMAGQVAGLVREMQRLAQFALDNPTQGLDARLARTQAQIDALRGGGLRRYEAVTGFQEQGERANQLAAEERDRVRRALEAGRQHTPEQIAARLRESDPARLLVAQGIAAREAERDRLLSGARDAERGGARVGSRVADAIRDAEGSAAAQRRIAEAYGQSEAAGRRAEAVERALAAVRKTGSDATEDESAAVQRLAQAFEAEARARADVQSRAAERGLRQEIELLQAQTRLLGVAAETRERELAALRARQQIEGRGGDPDTPASRAYVEAAQAAASARLEQSRMAGGLQEVQRIGEQAFARIGEAITQAFVAGEGAAVNWGNVARAMISEVAQALIRLAVINPAMNALFGTNQNTLGTVISALGGGAGGGIKGVAAADFVSVWAPSALGNAFEAGRLIPFAQGGVVDRPTLFPLANGAGLMGEAGPEGVLPLRRNARGELGVISSGGGAAVNQSITVNVTGGGPPGLGATASPEQARLIAAEVQKAVRAAAEDAIRTNLRLGGMLNPASGRAA